MKQYRRDDRSIEKFKEDIKTCTIIEKLLMEKYVSWLNSTSNNEYTYQYKGSDGIGDFKDDKEVTSEADFLLLKDGKRPRKIEIKFSRKNNYTFHIKLNHVNRCIREDYAIINWMGIDTEDPKFCILTPAILSAKLSEGKIVQFWKKDCLRWNSSELEWIHD